MSEQPAEDPARQIVAAMRALADAKPSLRFVLATDDRDDPKKHAVLKANCTEAEAVFSLSLALTRLTNPNRPEATSPEQGR